MSSDRVMPSFQWRITTTLVFFVGTLNVFLVLGEPQDQANTVRLFYVWIALLATLYLLMAKYHEWRLGNKETRIRLGDKMKAAVKADPRKKVLYLRPFGADKTTAALDSVESGITSIFRNPNPLTQEQNLQVVLALLGPVYAIGSPRDSRIPPPGVFRDYLDDDEDWQDVVLCGMKEAQLVAMVSGSDLSEGFVWEIKEILKLNDPTKLVIFPVGDEEEYLKFRSAAEKYFPKPLPDYPMKSFFRVRGVIQVMLYFDPGWQPKIGAFTGLQRQPLRQTVLPILSIVFDRIDPAWRRLKRRQLLRMVAIAIATFMVIAPGGFLFAAACMVILD